MQALIGSKMGAPERNATFSGLLLVAILIGAAVVTLRPASAAEQKIALVIGNAAYPTSRLRNPVNDAKAMADKLRALGFEVILRTDSNLREMTRSFSQFGQKLTPGGVSLFYYAGHGMQVRGKNYLIPVDAEIENETSVTSEAVDVDQLLNQLGPARLSMVILDACRNNPFERRFRTAFSGGLAQIDAPTGTLLAYATAPGKLAADGTGANGLYTAALLDALDIPGLAVEDVFKQVRISVVKSSDGLQTPWESSSLTGEFYFRPDNKARLADEMLKKSAQERAELVKKIDEERNKRDQDIAIIRAQMEKLREELQLIRAEAQAAGFAVAVAATTAKPEQVAIASLQPSAAATFDTASMPQSASGEWTRRVALLDKLQSQLTFAKAMALLLDITSTDDLVQLAQFEIFVRDAGWSSALAFGMDKEGSPAWAAAARFRLPTFASESALEHCTKEAGSPCKLLLLNGTFQEKDFLHWIHDLKDIDVPKWKLSLQRTIAKSPREFATSGGWARGTMNTSNMAVIYAPGI
ncbi:MAG: caspase family protein [Rhodocyclales bacterium]|nr:caspase family protein [Rhodocyclales bacterium]